MNEKLDIKQEQLLSSLSSSKTFFAKVNFEKNPTPTECVFVARYQNNGKAYAINYLGHIRDLPSWLKTILALYKKNQN